MTTVRVATFDGPGAPPVIREVPRPRVPRESGADPDRRLRRLRHRSAHPERPLAEALALAVHARPRARRRDRRERPDELEPDWTGQRLEVGAKVMLPPLMPCGTCYWCTHYPETANKCLTPVYYGRYLGFERPPHLWGGFAEMVYVDLEALPGTKIYKLPDDMPLRLARAVRAAHLVHPRVLPRAADRRLSLGSDGGDPGLGPDRRARDRRGQGDGGGPGDRGRRAGAATARALPQVRRRSHGEP